MKFLTAWVLVFALCAVTLSAPWLTHHNVHFSAEETESSEEKIEFLEEEKHFLELAYRFSMDRISRIGTLKSDPYFSPTLPILKRPPKSFV